jgi:hypothetical protein
MNTRRFAEGERVNEERRPPEPAPLPLHALLELQRTAGNQAVGRMLSRQIVTTKDRGSLVIAQGRGKPKPTGDAYLLKIYNELRNRLVPMPAAFTDVDAAAAALSGGGVIDADDIAFFAEKTGGKKSAATRAAEARSAGLADEVAAKRSSVEKYRHHIFKGDFSKKNSTIPTGYHSKAGASDTHQAYGTATPVANDVTGVYQQSVRATKTGVRKPIQSTFFPDTATEDQIMDALASVYGFTPQPKAATYPPSLKGLTFAKEGDTIYPAGGGDTAAEEAAD